MGNRGDPTNEQWERIETLLPKAKTKRGRPAQDHRELLNGMIWVLRTRAPWRDMPERYGKWTTIYNRFQRWRKTGVWDRMFAKSQTALDVESNVDWKRRGLRSKPGKISLIRSILSTAHDTGVPARLLKNCFSRESQFWPGVFRASHDAGLGQLTENGADTALLWNPTFFSQYCPLVLSANTCSKGYLNLKPGNQQILQQALVGNVNAACPNCPLGIDLSQANFSVDVFAHTLLAECEQTAQVILNNVPSSSTQVAGDFASYDDLWKFTLVNYNAGAGCLGLAINQTWSTEHKLTWDAMSSHFTDVCAPAKDYVNDISK